MGREKTELLRKAEERRATVLKRRLGGPRWWRVWIFEVVVGNYFGRFWPTTADPGSSGPQNLILDGLMALGTPHESSGAHLGPYF